MKLGHVVSEEPVVVALLGVVGAGAILLELTKRALDALSPAVVGDDLVFSTVGGDTIVAGNVRGPAGDDGINGDPAVAAAAAPLIPAGASAGTVSLVRGNGAVIADIRGLTKAGTGEPVATIPAGWRPAGPAGHCFLVDTAGAWWPAHATGTQIVVLGPPPVGTVLAGSIHWKVV